MNKELIKISKHLSYLLRHQTDSPKINDKGYASVKEILDILHITNKDLHEIVETNDKKRFEFSKDNKFIRAVQGHTINVDVDLKEEQPPNTLYHGTCTQFLASIMKNGLKKQKRLYVHLTEDINIAKNNGSRYGKPCVIIIDTQKMLNNNIKFWHSKNNVWLTNDIEPSYFKEIKYF